LLSVLSYLPRVSIRRQSAHSCYRRRVALARLLDHRDLPRRAVTSTFVSFFGVAERLLIRAEYQLPKLDVAGSNPVSRSINSFFFYLGVSTIFIPIFSAFLSEALGYLFRMALFTAAGRSENLNRFFDCH